MIAAVIGSGSWGTAIANLMAEKNVETRLWARDRFIADTINSDHRNPRYLTDVRLHDGIRATDSPETALKSCNIVVMAVPSHVTRKTLINIKPFVAGQPYFVSVTKGFEGESLMRMSQVIAEELPERNANVAVLSGPNHAEEVGEHIPSATVISSLSNETAVLLQETFMTSYFRVYTNPDIIGVELGGAIKNVIAIAAGISDGLGYGDNTKASLMTRGLAEMTRLGMAAGARQETFSGLSGVGDLIATCTSRHSRNRAVGETIARGAGLSELNKDMRMVAEGIRSSEGVCRLAKKLGVEMPISNAVREIIYQSKDPRRCVQELMTRGATDEFDLY